MSEISRITRKAKSPEEVLLFSGNEGLPEGIRPTSKHSSLPLKIFVGFESSWVPGLESEALEH